VVVDQHHVDPRPWHRAMLRQALGRFKSAVLADFALIDEMAEFTSEAQRRDDERKHYLR